MRSRPNFQEASPSRAFHVWIFRRGKPAAIAAKVVTDDDECHQTWEGFATLRVANYREAVAVSRVLDFLTSPALACRPQANGGFVICFTNTLKLIVPGCSVDQYPVRANNGLC